MENYPDDSPTKEEVERLINLFVGRHLLVPAVGDLDLYCYVIVPRSEAMAIGFKPDGTPGSNADTDTVEDFMIRTAVDPLYN